MNELRSLMDDHDDEDIRGVFDAYFDKQQPSPALDERLTRLVLREVQAVYAPELTPPPVAERRARRRFGQGERIRRWLRDLSPQQSLAMVGAGAFALLLAVFALSQIAPRPLTSAVTVTGGEVTILHQRNNTYRTYDDGDIFRVGKGDQVLTAGGTAIVDLFPLQTAEIEPDSHVVITQLDAMLESTQVELLVMRGRVNSIIDETLTDGDRYVVTSSVIEASVIGTEFSFETISTTEVVVVTKQGAVEVARKDQTVLVEAGQQVATLDGAPLVVEPSQNRLDRPSLLVVAPGDPGIPVYAEPDGQSSIIGFAAENMLLQVLSDDSSGEWYQICCVDGQTGWLRVGSIPPVTVEPADAVEPDANGESSQSDTVLGTDVDVVAAASFPVESTSEPFTDPAVLEMASAIPSLTTAPPATIVANATTFVAATPATTVTPPSTPSPVASPTATEIVAALSTSTPTPAPPTATSTSTPAPAPPTATSTSTPTPAPPTATSTST
ncbi:MAG: hypothetical protein R6W76_00330, partial [Caldilinea sp.]